MLRVGISGRGLLAWVPCLGSSFKSIRLNLGTTEAHVGATVAGLEAIATGRLRAAR